MKINLTTKEWKTYYTLCALDCFRTYWLENEKLIECVFVVEDKKVKLVPVKTGVQDSRYIEIKNGLKEGVEVVTGPFNAISKTLKIGIDVKVVPKDELFEGEKDKN